MKGTFHTPRESYIPKGATKIADKRSDAVAYLYNGSVTGRPCAMMFAGKQSKPAAHFNYRDEARREASVRTFFETRRDQITRAAARHVERKAFAHSVQVGDIYRTCWGYDQTNVEFFEVTEVRGKYAILREIGCASADNGAGSERVVPQSGAYLEPRHEGDDRGLPIRRLIQNGSIKIDNIRHARAWGQRVAGVVVGEAAHRTAAGWGH